MLVVAVFLKKRKDGLNSSIRKKRERERTRGEKRRQYVELGPERVLTAAIGVHQQTSSIVMWGGRASFFPISVQLSLSFLHSPIYTVVLEPTVFFPIFSLVKASWWGGFYKLSCLPTKLLGPAVCASVCSFYASSFSLVIYIYNSMCAYV